MRDMKLLRADSDNDLTELEALIDSEIEARRRIDTLAPKILLDSMESHGWEEVIVDPEHLSLIERVVRHDGTTADLSQIEMDELNEEAINIVGQCPRELFQRRNGEYFASRTELTRWAAKRQY